MGRADTGGRRVLVVDDDGDTRDMYSESLRAEGFDVRAARTAEEALGVASTFLPTVVVTDLRLQGKIDGLELTRRLRADGRTAGTRIIMLTGASLDNEPQHAKAAGCDRFVVKPCLPETLATEIRDLAAQDARALRPAARPRRA